MKHFLLCWVTPFLLFLLLAGPALATDYQAGELTYEALGADRYRVQLRLYRDCAGAAFPASLALSCRVGSAQTACTSTDARNFTAALTLVGNPTPATPYCTPTPLPGANQCGATAPINTEEAVFAATVTLPPAPEWTLSWDSGQRAPAANLQGAATQALYLQATLRTMLTLADGSQRPIANSSAQYQLQDKSTAFVCAGQRTTLTFSTFEVDGDSLVYSLEQPQYGCNQLAPYQTFATNGQLPALLQTNGQLCPATLAAGSATIYSAQLPVPSYVLTGSCPTIQAAGSFRFNAQLGSFSFTPVYFGSFDPADRSRNTYALVGKITEYRRIGGRYYEVGATYRNMLVVVVACEQFQYPSHALLLGPMQLYGTTQLRPLTDLVQVPPGQTAGVLVRASDPDGIHQISLTARWPQYYPGIPPLALVPRGPGQLGIELAVPAGAPEGLYKALIIGQNNNCPRQESAFDTLRFYVTTRPLATATAAGVRPLSAAPNPFTDAVTICLPGLSASPATLTITNALGQVVARLPVRPSAAGTAATASWQPGPEVPPGVYFARTTDGRTSLRLVRTQP